MNLSEFLTQLPSFAGFSRKSKNLVFAYFLRKYQGQTELGTKEFGACYREAMLRVPGDLSALLKSQSNGRNSTLIKSRARGRYSISIYGVQEVESVLPQTYSTPEATSTFLTAAVPYLKKTIAKVSNPVRKEYLAEAISCLAVGARRATIVLTWIATMDHLYEYVLQKKLVEFQSALSCRNDRISQLTITGRDELTEIKESAFIEVCRSANIVTNDVRKILDEKLGTRNSCAHPSTITIGESKVVSFIEDLVDNVIAKYAV